MPVRLVPIAANVIGSICILAGSFWITLKLIDNWSSSPTSASGAPPSASASLPREPAGRNLVAASENLESVISLSGITALARVPGQGSTVNVYRLTPVGPRGEHYAVVPAATAGGLYTVSVQARATGTSRFRIGLRDLENNGVIADINLKTGEVTLSPIGTTSHFSGTATAKQNWRDIRVTTMLPKPNAAIFLQVMDDAGTGTFAPGNEAVLLRGLQLVRGENVPAYPGL
jgi:hypothetical protein